MASTIENLYNGDGYNFLFPFTFQYVKEDDVKVSLNDVDTSEYSLSNATTVQLNAAPPVGTVVRVYRQTDTTAVPSTFYSGSTITAKGLNDNFAQTLFVAQEVQKAQEEALDSSQLAGEAITQAQAAQDQALAATETANVAVSSANAATSTATSAATSASNAVTTANSALVVANEAELNIQGALDASEAAVAASNAVVSTAETAEANAATALTVANQASADVDDLQEQLASGPVSSVNSQQGVVVLTASDVGAATTAQGSLADSAVQPGDLATVATSGDYNDLSNQPTLFSGDYNDLSNQPTIPTIDPDTVVSDVAPTFTATVQTTERTITGTFDLATGNHWTCGAITVPAPTNAVAGTSGLIRITAGPVVWNAVFKFPGGAAPVIASFPAVVPFYVQDATNILMGNVAEGIA